jgi:hypothetical protein
VHARSSGGNLNATQSHKPVYKVPVLLWSEKSPRSCGSGKVLRFPEMCTPEQQTRHIRSQKAGCYLTQDVRVSNGPYFTPSKRSNCLRWDVPLTSNPSTCVICALNALIYVARPRSEWVRRVSQALPTLFASPTLPCLYLFPHGTRTLLRSPSLVPTRRIPFVSDLSAPLR